MKTKHLFLMSLVVSLLLGLSACHDNNEFSTYKDLKDNRWVKNEKISFPFTLSTNDTLDLGITLRLAYEYPFNNVKFNAILYHEGKGIQATEINSVVKDENGEYMGEILGGLIDFKWPIFSRMKLKKGEYKIEFEQVQEQAYLPYVVDVGAFAEHP